MKLHYFSAMLVAAMAAIACQPQDKAFEPKLEVDGITLMGGAVAVDAAGTSLSFSVTGNVAFTITSDKDWVEATPQSVGNADKNELKTNVTIAVNPNTAEEPRSAKVKIAADGNSALDYTFTINQAAAKYERYIEVRDALESAVTGPIEIAASGASASVTVVSTVSWTAVANVPWLIVEPASATIENYKETSSAVKLNVAANASDAPRNATVTFISEEVEPVVVNVSQAANVNYTFSVDVVDITTSSATVTCTPSDENVHYLISCEPVGYVNQFASDAELVAADIEYFRGVYGSNYGEYGFSSFEHLFYDGLCVNGNKSVSYKAMNDAADYVAYVFAVDDKLNLISDVFKKEFTTEKNTLEFYGNAMWTDVFTKKFFNVKLVAMPCDVYTDASRPGVFFFDSPYWYNNIASWFSLTPEEMKKYDGNYRQVYIEIDCSSPEAVTFAVQELGYALNPDEYGWYLGGGLEGAKGTYSNNTITFDAAALCVGMTKYQNGTLSPTVSNEGELTFTVEITPGGSPAKPASVALAKTTAGHFTKMSAPRIAPAKSIAIR